MPHIGEENSVLSLQYPEGRHSIPIFIAYEPRRQLIQTLQTQQHNSQRQREHDSPFYYEVETFVFCNPRSAG